MYYFGYGSNFNHKQMNKRCRNAKYIGLGIISGKNLVFRGRNDIGYYADIIDDNSKYVQVAVWNIDENDFYMLDLYEQVSDGLYKRKKCECMLQDGSDIVKGIYYKMNDKFTVGEPSDSYIRTYLKDIMIVMQI